MCLKKVFNWLNCLFTIHGSISLKLELLELRFQDVSINLIIVNDKNAGLKSFFRDLILRLLLDYTISTFIRVFIVLEIKDNCLFSTRKLLLHLLAVFSQELVVNERRLKARKELKEKAKAEKIFKDVNEAYAILSDPEKRK